MTHDIMGLKKMTKVGDRMAQLKVLYFSPVGTTKKIADAIVEGLNIEAVQWIDLSKPENRQDEISFSQDDIVLMTFPVYAGRVVRVPRYYFKSISANGAKAITAVTYGNRAYDDALLELSKLSRDAGFIQIAAGAFVCEHSFDIGLATGRPDASDVYIATQFGERVMGKINELIHNPEMLEKYQEAGVSNIPGEFPFRTQFRHDFGGPLVPSTSEACSNCLKCARNCPVEAIDFKNPKETDQKKCIACFRCIRHCPNAARKIELPDFIDHAKWLAKEYQMRKEPDLFI